MSKEYSKKDFNLLMEEFQALHDEKPKKVEKKDSVRYNIQQSPIFISGG